MTAPDKGPSLVCEATRLRTGLRCTHPAKFRVWPRPLHEPRSPVEEAHKVLLVCGTHANSYVITMGWQYDEDPTHTTTKAVNERA